MHPKPNRIWLTKLSAAWNRWSKLVLVLVLTGMLVGLGWFSLQQLYLSKRLAAGLEPSFSDLRASLSKLKFVRSQAESTPKDTAAQPVRLVFAGDVMLDRGIGDAIKQGKNPFQFVDQEFKNSFTVVNLECVVSDKGSAALGKKFTFEADPSSLDLLPQNSVELVTLANNHTMDYGPLALSDMLQRLDAKKMPHTGAGLDKASAFKPKIMQVEGLNIAFIGLNDIETSYTAAGENTPGNATLVDTLAIQSIKEARQNADLVIVLPHWGVEYSLQPSARQQTYAKKFLDAGADAVIGAHPHVNQPLDWVGGKPVVYSLGNFVFDGMDGMPNATDGQMAEVILQDKQIKSVKLIPVKLDAQGFPRLS